MAARSLMYLFLVGGLVASAALASPLGESLDTLRLAMTAGASVSIAAALVIGYDRLPNWTLSVFLLCGSMLIEWAVYAGNDSTSPFLLFYLWIAFYAFYFLSRVQAAVQAAFIGFAYAVVLALGNESFKLHVVRWIVFVLGVVVAGLLVRVMRERIDALLRTLDEQLRTDMLTGLLDCRGFDEVLQKELERARRSDNRVGIVLGTVDGSGTLRERLGDRQADEAIAAVGKKVGATVRLNDEAARLGDELFAVICPYTDERGGAIMAERAATIVRESYAGTENPHTVSFGVASYPKHGTSPDSLLQAARHALSEAKELGGDRTVTSYSAENSIEDRLRGSDVAVDIEVMTS